MDKLSGDPHSFGLPHDSWRPNQLSFLQGVISKIEDGKQFIFGELPTGSGKSSVPTALGRDRPVLVLTQTLGLLKQYEREYGFSIVMGRPEYACVFPDKVRRWKIYYNKTPTAADCHFARMSDCAYASDCPYIQARASAISAKRAGCTYRYASLSEEFKRRPGVLVLDEAHNSVEELLSFSEFKLTSDHLDAYELPDFPLAGYGEGGRGDILDIQTRGAVLVWLLQCGLKVGRVDTLDLMSEEGARQKGFARFIDQGIKLLESPIDLFLYCGEDRSSWTPQRCLLIKPMSVVDIAADLWHSKQSVILMSATIGNPAPLAGELGINEFDSMSYPHPVPSDYRPVYDLGVEKMTWENIKNNSNLSRIQAILIGQFIEKLNPDWRGIVLTTANYKIKFLREFLAQKFHGRVFIPSKASEHSVVRRISEFLESKRKGLIAVDTIQGWGSGLDLRFDLARFVVVAGVPFLNPSERYDVLRAGRPGGRKYSLWNSYNAITQACGRVSRGERQNNDWLLNVAALADGSATTPQALGSYPRWFREAIQ